MSSAEIAYCGEGRTDAAVARRLIEAVGAVPGTDYLTARRRRGKDALDGRLRGFNILARSVPVLVLRDLDRDAACAGKLVAALLPERESLLLLRVAVRSVESWLMADREALAGAMHIRASALPQHPEEEQDPKRLLAHLLRDCRDRTLRRRLGLDGRVGLQPQLVAAELSDFAANRWDPARAAASGRAPSLARSLARLRGLAGG